MAEFNNGTSWDFQLAYNQSINHQKRRLIMFFVTEIKWWRNLPGTASTQERHESGSSSRKMEGLCVAAGYRSLLFSWNLINNSSVWWSAIYFSYVRQPFFFGGGCSAEMFMGKAGISADKFLRSVTLTGDTLICDSGGMHLSVTTFSNRIGLKCQTLQWKTFKRWKWALSQLVHTRSYMMSESLIISNNLSGTQCFILVYGGNDSLVTNRICRYSLSWKTWFFLP